MKELLPAIWDDLELAETGTKIPADVSVAMSYKGRDMELDLTAEHAAELDEFIQRYLRADRSQRGRPQPALQGKSPDPAKVSRNRGIRLFAEDHGLSYRTTTGKLYYDGALQAAYDAFMRGEDWSAAYDNWQPSHGRRLQKPRRRLEVPQRASA